MFLFSLRVQKMTTVGLVGLLFLLLGMSTHGGRTQQQEAMVEPEDGVEAPETSGVSLFQKAQMLGKLPGGFDELEQKEQPRKWAQSLQSPLDLSTAVDLLFGMLVCALFLHFFQGKRESETGCKGSEKKKMSTKGSESGACRAALGLFEARGRRRPSAAGKSEDVNQDQEKKALSPKTSELHAAIVSENLAKCEALLNAGADVNTRDAWLCTPLHIASHRGSLLAVRLLLRKNAKVDPVEAWDQTPLHLACAGGHQAVVALLLREGADKDAMDAQDRTPLFLAGENKHAGLASFLLQKGAGLGRGMPEERVPALLKNLILQQMLETAARDLGAGAAGAGQQELSELEEGGTGLCEEE